MADEVKSGVKSVTTKVLGIHPGLAIVSFWQGIVEIVLRAVVLALALIVIIAGATAQGELDIFLSADSGLPRNATSANGWLMFVGFVCLFYQAAVIVVRFLNIGFVNAKITIFLIIDICVNGGSALGYFAGSAAAADYSRQISDSTVDSTFAARWARCESATGATAAFGFFSIVALGGLIVLMVLFIVLGWNSSVTKYAVKGAAADAVEAK